MSTAKDETWDAKEEEMKQKEQEQTTTLHTKMEAEAQEAASRINKDFEGGYGGQDDLEDRYATTSGEH